MLAVSAFLTTTITLGGCGGDGGDDSAAADNNTNSNDNVVRGLAIPENMSIVTAKGGNNPANMLARAFTDASTDYSTDPANTYVYDRAMEPLSTVNMILCLMDQTAASEMVNQGPYIAMVNEDKCEQGQNQSNSANGPSNSAQATQFNNWTINSTRASNDDPQIVELWVPGDEPNPTDPQGVMSSQTIVIEMRITEGASDSNPFGSFTMNFKGVVDGSEIPGGTAGEEVELMHGILETVDNNSSSAQFRFYNATGITNDDSLNLVFGSEEAVNVIMEDADGTAGKAITTNQSAFSSAGAPILTTTNYAIAFNATNLARGIDNDDDQNLDEAACLSRDDFNTQVWRYNLYHKDAGTFNNQQVVDGQRVEVNSGFPFSYDSNNDTINDAYGYVSYMGLWSDSGNLADGTNIVEFDYVNDAEINHTINVSNGRLIRRIASSEPLSTFQGDEFMFWGWHPNLQRWDQWIVVVSNDNNFSITEHVSWGDAGPERSTTFDNDNNPETPEVDVTAILNLLDHETISFWSDALNTNVVYTQDNSVAPGARTVTYYGDEYIYPGDANLFANSNDVTLYCYERCLIGGLTQADVDAASDDDDLLYAYAGTPFQYMLSSTNGKLVLTDVSNNMEVSAADLDMSALGFGGGISTGEMVTSPLVNAAEPWLVYEQPETYRFETGANEWNRLVTVTDANDQVETFSPPLHFPYTHSTENDANNDPTYDGKKFVLEYNGPGNLWGFPWVSDDDGRRWHRAITLADGTELSDGNNTFVVKAVESEQSMQAVNSTECDSLDAASVLSDPNLTLPTSADLNAISNTVADKPVVTDAPAVIEGELQ